jgi:PDZ domain
MFRTLVVALLLTGVAFGEDPLHIYYYSGQVIEQLSVRNVTVSLSLAEAERVNQIAVFVDNRSSDAVNVLPENFAVHQGLPKDQDLAAKSQQEIEKIAGSHALWGHMAGGMGSGIRRYKNKVSGADEESVDTSAAFEAQAQWLAQADDLAKRGQMNALGRLYLRGSTVFPKANISGVLWFDRSEAFASGTVKVVLGSRTYLFPFPPPASATTPAVPGKPSKAAETPRVKDTPDPSAPEPAPSKPGVLGASGENWTQDEFGGVKIDDVAANSAAEMAGLRIGYVITDINGKRVKSTEELAVELAKYGPGERILVAYLVKTNLGWMPQKTAVILGAGD